jgi:crotonobetainyl-CoA:carnitine CoA-transferase CaiB-like acyl-CoA transferase
MDTGNKNVDKHLEQLLKNGSIEPFSGLNINVSGNDPVMDTPWHIGEAAAAALAAQGIALSKIWDIRKGKDQKQTIDIDVASAALSTLRCNFMKQNGYSIPFPDIDYPTVGIYETKDKRHVFINGGFPGLRRGILKILNCPDNRESIALALSKWNAKDIEREAQEKGYCCVMCRTSDEWLENEHGKALFDVLSNDGFINPVTIEKICDTEPQPFSELKENDKPLSNIKVLDLTHVLAGPTCGMMLAEQDATVMRVNGPQIPFILPFVMDTGHGKLNVQIDLKTDEGRDTLWDLIENGADVFSESYRPEKLDSLGYSAKAIAERLKAKGKGIIYVSINCYGYNGPWKDLPGWEQLAQATTGLACEQGKEGDPQLLPTFPDDYITGYLAAYGVLAALQKRHLEGGSYHVKVSLCATAMWLQTFGEISQSELPPKEIDSGVVEKNIISNENTGYGDLKYFGHPIRYSETKAGWKRPTVPIGYNKPQWPN